MESASPRVVKKVASKEYALWEVQRVDHDGGQIVYEVWSVEPYAFLFGIHDDLTHKAKAIATSIVAEHNCRLVPTPSPTGTEEVRDVFEEWAHRDNRRIEPEEYEERTPDNYLYYADDSTNHAYVGWCAAIKLARSAGIEPKGKDNE